MKTMTIGLAAAFAVALSGCYAQLEDHQVVIRDSVPVPVPNSTGGVEVTLTQFAFDVGDITIDEHAKDSKLTLLSATLVVPATAPADFFDGMTKASVTISAPAGSGLAPVTLSYQQVAGSNPGRSLKLTDGQATNLLPYLQLKNLDLAITLQGSATTLVTSSADIDLEFDLLGKVNFP